MFKLLPGLLLRRSGFLLLCLLAPFVLGQANEGDLVDPTRPLVRNGSLGDNAPADLAALFGNYRVRSILIRSGVRYAVINDQRVREGDVIAGARVEAIDSGRVLLRIGEETRELKLYPGSIKRPTDEAVTW